MLANGDRARRIAAHVAVAFAFIGVIGCLLGLFGGLFFGHSLLFFLGPLSLIAMLPMVVYRSMAARISFWTLAAAFVAWQIATFPPGSLDELLIPEFAVIYGSMWFLFALLVGRALWLQWRARK